jgi:hypothetical protein
MEKSNLQLAFLAHWMLLAAGSPGENAKRWVDFSRSALQILI